MDRKNFFTKERTDEKYEKKAFSDFFFLKGIFDYADKD